MNHYTLLLTIEDACGLLPTLGHAAAKSPLKTIWDEFTLPAAQAPWSVNGLLDPAWRAGPIAA